MISYWDVELLPCPICGNSNIILHNNSSTGNGWWIQCLIKESEGYHQLFIHYSTKEEAVKKWNTIPRNIPVNHVSEQHFVV